jgi:hypothetical protein
MTKFAMETDDIRMTQKSLILKSQMKKMLITFFDV